MKPKLFLTLDSAYIFYIKYQKDDFKYNCIMFEFPQAYEETIINNIANITKNKFINKKEEKIVKLAREFLVILDYVKENNRFFYTKDSNIYDILYKNNLIKYINKEKYLNSLHISTQHRELYWPSSYLKKYFKVYST